jgi:hypothetical protein
MLRASHPSSALMNALLLRLAGMAAGTLLCLAAWAETVAGSGRVASETRPVGEFNAIAVNGTLRLDVRQAGTPRLQVQGEDNLLPLLETKVEGGRLLIRPKRGVEFRPRQPIVVTVDAVTLKALSAAGNNQVNVSGLKTPALALDLSGSGGAVLRDLTTESLSIDLAGSGDVDVDGSARRLEVSIAGSGDLRATGLKSEDAKVAIAGSGDARVAAARRLQVSIAGSGNVRYAGDPVVRESIVGSGRVRRD